LRTPDLSFFNLKDPDWTIRVWTYPKKILTLLLHFKSIHEAIVPSSDYHPVSFYFSLAGLSTFFDSLEVMIEFWMRVLGREVVVLGVFQGPIEDVKSRD